MSGDVSGDACPLGPHGGPVASRDPGDTPEGPAATGDPHTRRRGPAWPLEVGTRGTRRAAWCPTALWVGRWHRTERLEHAGEGVEERWSLPRKSRRRAWRSSDNSRTAVSE